jgi:hypothetical protein
VPVIDETRKRHARNITSKTWKVVAKNLRIFLNIVGVLLMIGRIGIRLCVTDRNNTPAPSAFIRLRRLAKMSGGLRRNGALT